jgi:hypothetical protein
MGECECVIDVVAECVRGRHVTEYTLVFISTGCYGRLRRASGARTARALALRATFSAKFRRFSGQLMPERGP